MCYNDSVDKIKTRRKDQHIKKPATITNHDAQKIMDHLDGRNRDIFWIGIETGLRISDILRLCVRDVQKNPLCVYESKSKQSRTIEISDKLSQHLTTKYKFRFSFGSDNALKCLFPSFRGTGRPINRSTYHRALKRAEKALKINFSAHSTRKLYAQNKFAQSGSIIDVQKALNHKYVTTTAAYLDIDIDALIGEAVKLKHNSK